MNLQLDEMTALAVEKIDGELAMLTPTGSRAYGTHTAASDYDFRGVYVAPLYNVLSLIEPKMSYAWTDPHDAVVYELSHFCRLAAGANPTALEVLWGTGGHFNAVGAMLRQHRHLFLSQQIRKTYGGYAIAQLKKAREGTGGSRGQDHHKRMKFRLHTIRLVDAGVAALRDGEVPVRVNDPAALVAMAENTALEPAALENYVNNKLRHMDYFVSLGSLPERPDYDAINDLIYTIRMGLARPVVG